MVGSKEEKPVIIKFHLNKIWVFGPIDFDDSADVVALAGDLRITVDGRDVPGVGSPEQGAFLNDWLRHLHMFLTMDAFDQHVDTRDLLDEEVHFLRKDSTTLLRVVRRHRRAVPGFEGVPLEHAQLRRAIGAFELRLKELLLEMTSFEKAALWWRRRTHDSIDKAGAI